jgi:hypothetical protein
MKEIKYAFILMGPCYNLNLDNDDFETFFDNAYIVGVKNFVQACVATNRLIDLGVTHIELSGGFDSLLAQRLIDITENKVAIGYMTHFPIQDDKFKQILGN